jgi:hypothetical protein
MPSDAARWGPMDDLIPVVVARDAWIAVLARDDETVQAEAEARLLACRDALTVVGQRLATMGYPVQPIVRPLDPGRLDEVESALHDAGIPVPPLLSTLWRVVGSVSVLDLDRYRHASFWRDRLQPTDRCTDGLHIDSPGTYGDDYESFAGYVLDEHEEWIESGAGEDGEPFEWPIAPDDLHKDNISGGEPYGLSSGVGGWDHRVVNLTWRGDPVTLPPGGDPDLVSYLRTVVLECGCFPGLLGLPDYEPDRQHLTAGLPVF